MNTKKASYENIEPSKYSVYFDKAEAFFRAMTAAYRDENRYSTGLEAVHCAISATDALLAKRFGIRCTGKDHRDVIRLIQERMGPQSKEQAALLSRIINMKNQIEYEDRMFTAKEAEEIFKRTDRYYNWIKTQLAGSQERKK